MLLNLFLKNIIKKKSIFNLKKTNKVYFNSYNYIDILHLYNNISNNIKSLLILYTMRLFKTQHIRLLSNLNSNILTNNNNIYSIFTLVKLFYNFNNSFIIFSTTINNNCYPLINNLLFIKWFSLELSNDDHLLSSFSLPKKSSKYTLLRSPFVFKKGREEFEHNNFKTILNYSNLLGTNIFKLLIKHNNRNFLIKHKYNKYYV